MKICGIQKISLLDYPEHLSSILFIGGCNFCCPFCHNSGLLQPPFAETYEEEAVLQYLSKRKNILEGVCITGGEPLLHKELPFLIKKIRDLGYPVKLDTNGSRPDALKNLIADGLLDYVAMDIKASFAHYPLCTGLSREEMEMLWPAIEQSAFILMESKLPDYEFRTTVVQDFHTEEDFFSISHWLAGAKHYYLQSFQNSGQVLKKGLSSPSRETLIQYQSILSASIPNTALRGLD